MAIMGVKFGGCGINLVKAKAQTNAIEKKLLFKSFNKFLINNFYPVSLN